MKAVFVFLVLLGAVSMGYGQSLPNYTTIALEDKEDYNAEAEAAALKAANYLLESPVAKKDLYRLNSAAYLLKWMTGTPAYTFSLDDDLAKVWKSNDDILLVYMASMSKYVLEHPDQAKNAQDVKLHAFKLLIDYVKVPKNNIKVNGELKKLVEAGNKGELETYLHLK